MVAAFGVACVGGWWLASSPAPIFVDAALCAVFAATFLFSAAESAAPEAQRELAGRPTLTASVESDGRIRALNTPLARVLQPGSKGVEPERLQDILTPTESVESALEAASRGVFEKKEGYIWLPGGGLTHPHNTACGAQRKKHGTNHRLPPITLEEKNNRPNRQEKGQPILDEPLAPYGVLTEREARQTDDREEQ